MQLLCLCASYLGRICRSLLLVAKWLLLLLLLLLVDAAAAVVVIHCQAWGSTYLVPSCLRWEPRLVHHNVCCA
jgi:hypothetical protein